MYFVIKRIVDIAVSFLTLTIFSWLILIIVVMLAVTNGISNVFFIQPRPGKNGKIFRLIKFKTMTDKKDNLGNLLPDDKRMTKLGSLIRKLSLDEFPQLINVLKGDMSLVGPRPLLVEYLPFYNDFQKRRHNVKPGITGWAQVNGRNTISWNDKFRYDVWYVENKSIKLELKILFMTIKKVIKSEGISSNTSITMEKFMGGN